MAKLILSVDGQVLKEFTLSKERTLIGRKPHNDIQIDNLAVSGEHAAIIEQYLWDKVHAILAENVRTRSANTRAQTPALLKGRVFGPTGAAMSPTHTRKGNRLYRYYKRRLFHVDSEAICRRLFVRAVAK